MTIYNKDVEDVRPSEMTPTQQMFEKLKEENDRHLINTLKIIKKYIEALSNE